MPDAPRALVVEDSASWRDILAEILSDMGLVVDLAVDLPGAVTALRERPHRVAVVDLALADDAEQNRDGLHVLDAAHRLDPGCVGVLLTGFATVDIAVSAITEHGAFTCLRKEAFRRAEFREVVRRALALAPVGGLPAESAPEAPPAAAAFAWLPRVALLVEDDAGWRSILAELLTDAGFDVRACLSYGEALGHLRRERLALAVVDLSLASSLAPRDNRDGLQVLREAQAAGIPAIVVSGLAGRDDVERAYAEYGIFAYVEKQSFDRRAFGSTAQGAADSGLAEPGAIARLTPRERDVLALVVQGLTNKGIAHALVISENTVKRYLKSIFEKLDVDSRAAATAKAVSAGMK